MNRRAFSKTLLSLTALPLTSSTKATTTVRLLRHATLVVQMGDTSFLVDPMLSPKGAMDPVTYVENKTRIPMVDLPVNDDELTKILSDVDAVLVTHTHRDHWDDAAQQKIDKAKLIFCQTADLEKLKGQGFTNVRAIGDKDEFQGITIHRTGGQHGPEEIGKRMGPVSGFVLEAGSDKLYLAGDTIWCAEVEEALRKFKPQTTVVNAGAAQFLTGESITMTDKDVVKVAKTNMDMRTIAVHMETVNHCVLTRKDLMEKIDASKLRKQVLIPNDGDTV